MPRLVAQELGEFLGVGLQVFQYCCAPSYLVLVSLLPGSADATGICMKQVYQIPAGLLNLQAFLVSLKIVKGIPLMWCMFSPIIVVSICS